MITLEAGMSPILQHQCYQSDSFNKYYLIESAFNSV